VQSRLVRGGNHHVLVAVVVEVADDEEVRPGGQCENLCRREKGYVPDGAFSLTLQCLGRMGIQRIDVAPVHGEEIFLGTCVAADQVRHPVLVQVARDKRRGTHICFLEGGIHLLTAMEKVSLWKIRNRCFRRCCTIRHERRSGDERTIA
jgi:hypothetical protein